MGILCQVNCMDYTHNIDLNFDDSDDYFYYYSNLVTDGKYSVVLCLGNTC